MFTIEDWPTARAHNVAWFPCQQCGEWFFRIVACDDPSGNLLTILAVCWSEFDMRCELCDYAHRNALAESKAKHPAFWKRGAR